MGLALSSHGGRFCMAFLWGPQQSCDLTSQAQHRLLWVPNVYPVCWAVHLGKVQVSWPWVCLLFDGSSFVVL